MVALDLHQIAWMRLQWKRFRRLLWGATGGVWVLCGSGILLAGEEDFLVRIALLAMLITSTGLSLYLFWSARRETKELERKAIEIRAVMTQEKQARTRKSAR